MRIVNTSAFGWIDMAHVIRVTPVEWENNGGGSGGWLSFYVYVMMRDKPFKWTGEWSLELTQDQSDDANKSIKCFMLLWRG